jgi:hypothetical protein
MDGAELVRQLDALLTGSACAPEAVDALALDAVLARAAPRHDAAVMAASLESVRCAAEKQTNWLLRQEVPPALLLALGLPPDAGPGELASCVSRTPAGALNEALDASVPLVKRWRFERLFRFFRTIAYVHLAPNVSTHCADGFSRLSLAAVQGDLVSVNLLLVSGADPTFKDGQGLTAIDYLVRGCEARCPEFGLSCEHQPIKTMLIAACACHASPCKV